MARRGLVAVGCVLAIAVSFDAANASAQDMTGTWLLVMYGSKCCSLDDCITSPFFAGITMGLLRGGVTLTSFRGAVLPEPRCGMSLPEEIFVEGGLMCNKTWMFMDIGEPPGYEMCFRGETCLSARLFTGDLVGWGPCMMEGKFIAIKVSSELPPE